MPCLSSPTSLEPLEPRIALASVTGLLGALDQADAYLANDLAQFSPVAPPALPTSALGPVELFTSEHAGFIIATKLTEFETAGFKGTLESFVVRRTATTDAVSLPLGGLDFYYQIAVTSGDPRAAINSVTLGLFDPSLVSAGADARSGPIVSTDPLNGRDGGSQLPVLVSYAAGAVQFDYTSATASAPLTAPLSTSGWLVLRTDARSYDDTGSATLTGAVTGTEATIPLSTTAAILAPTETAPAPRTLVVTGAGSGSLVQVFDPATGVLKESFQAFGARNKYGVRVATGDVNGDGVEDIIAGSGRNSVGGAQVRLFDGANPAHPLLLGFKPFGAGFVGAVNVAAGDVDGDGRDDIIVAPASGSAGQVRVFSGLDGSLLGKFTALAKVNGGVRIAAGDLDGDGRDEVIVGAGVGSAVRVFDGLAGVAVNPLNFRAFESAYTGGVNVAAGDVNGDGIDEIIVSTASGSDRVGVFNFALTKLAEIRTTATSGVRVSAADVNGDGFADIVASRAPAGNNAVSVFSGTTRAKLFDLSGYTVGGKAGAFVG